MTPTTLSTLAGTERDPITTSPGMSFLRRGSAVVVLVLTALLTVLFGAGSALAHVTVNSPGATQGGYAVLTFRVPTESDTASTTEIKVQLPLDQPLASVAVQPTPGWSFTVTKTKLATPITTDDGPVTEAISVIDWKADSAATAIKPGEFQQFMVSAGPLPKAASMTFKVLQTYSDKSVVSWIQEAAPGSSAEPDHPAPTLQLAAAGAATTDSSTTASSPPPSVTATASDSSSGKATTGLVLGIIGIILGGAALALVLLRGRRTTA